MPRKSKGSRTLLTSRVPDELAVEAAAWADQQGFVHISDALADLIALGLKQDKLPSTYMPGVTMRANGQSELPLREAMHLKAS